jgi:tRNA-splicing endonuclease subunit Sen54
VSIIPFHSPPDTPSLINPYADGTTPVATVTYHAYRPTSSYRKTNPGPPDFYISVIDARTQALPTAGELEVLLRQTPYMPTEGGAGKMYPNLRNGYRSVILAVVDQGVVSLLRVADAAFGCYPLWKRPPPKAGQRRHGNNKGGKKGGPRTSK